MNESQTPQPIGGAIGVILGFALIIIFLMIAWPTGHSRRSDRASGCTANLKQIGNSLKMYLCDWDETYPTNRKFTTTGKLGPISNYVKLSDIGTNADGKPYKFQHGVNWVEGLYNYMEPIVARDDKSSVWKCPASTGKANSESAEVSYAFNRNLIEQPENVIRSGSTQMVVSEVDGLLDAELRPTNKSNKNPKAAPQNVFSNSKIHGAGSHILFADGHSKLYRAAQFFAKGCEWDAETKSWYNSADQYYMKWDEKTQNWVKDTAMRSTDRGAIQITP